MFNFPAIRYNNITGLTFQMEAEVSSAEDLEDDFLQVVEGQVEDEVKIDQVTNPVTDVVEDLVKSTDDVTEDIPSNPDDEGGVLNFGHWSS